MFFILLGGCRFLDGILYIPQNLRSDHWNVDYLEKKIQERPWGAFVYLGLLYGAFPGVLLAGSMIAQSVKQSGSDQSLFNNATASNSAEVFECTLDRRLFVLN